MYKNIYFLLLLFSVSVRSQNSQVDLKTLFELDSPGKILQKFGKENVQRIRPDILIKDEIPFEYAVFKGTPNEFSILFSEGNIIGVVVRKNYTGNYLKIPYKAGLTLKEIAEINKGRFSFRSNLSNINWYGGFLGEMSSCIDIQLSPKDYIKGIDFQNKYSQYELFNTSPEVGEMDISISRIIYYKCSLFLTPEQWFGSFTDARDGKIYRTISIGNQTWMADNLAFKMNTGCWAYNNNNALVSKYGYLYNWDAMKSACPSGWHVPTDEEWKTLTDNFSSESTAFQFKSTNGWEQSGNGNNQTGLSLLPAGFRSHDGSFTSLGSLGLWWTSTENNSISAWFRAASSSGNMERMAGNKQGALSIRCIKD